MTLLFLAVAVVASTLYPTSAAKSYGDWAIDNGVTFNPKVSFSGTSMTATADISKGDVMATVPLTKEEETNPNARLFALHMGEMQKYPDMLAIFRNESRDETTFSPSTALAVFILYEHFVAKDDSKWASLLNRWSYEGTASTMLWPEEDIELLKGTEVYKKTAERFLSVKEVHAELEPLVTSPHTRDDGSTADPLFNEFPFTLFAIAITNVLARSFQVQGSGGATVPIIVPVFEALPRSSHVDAIYEEREGNLVLVAGRNFQANEKIGLFRGPMSNSLWMLDHGTFVNGNQYTSLPLSVRLGEDDITADIKSRALKQLNHTEGGVYELTSANNGHPPEKLLRVMRIFFLNANELNLARKVIQSDKPVSLANELKVLRAIVQACRSLLGNYGNSTLEDDKKKIEAMAASRGENQALSRPQVAMHAIYEEKRILYMHIAWVTTTWNRLLSAEQTELDQFVEFRD